ncbi:protein of unknown function [Nitrospira japonica]|uniref:DprA winged helix domain-containing protein n=1 Tax=Nitrospira japonica TaxID=1325564 RepID=A0A1W1IA61_9BACT|nr:hypothetical protein [Nitrospira japonica]SLM49653.1 protein of unknown function [Nitrospira japonica]
MITLSTAAYEHADHSLPEDLILDRLQDGRRFTIEEMLVQVPELSWAQLFLAMDILSRRGDVELRRRGFTYTLKRVRAAAMESE